MIEKNMNMRRQPNKNSDEHFDTLSLHCLLHFTLPIFFRRDAHYPFEILPEKRLRRKIQFVADLLDSHIGGLEQRFSLQNNVVVIFDYLRQIFWRKAQFVDIDCETAKLFSRLRHCRNVPDGCPQSVDIVETFPMIVRNPLTLSKRSRWLSAIR
jgi:hypothetical protein